MQICIFRYFRILIPGYTDFFILQYLNTQIFRYTTIQVYTYRRETCASTYIQSIYIKEVFLISASDVHEVHTKSSQSSRQMFTFYAPNRG